MNPETRSELVVPLFYKGRSIGVLDLEHTRTAFFNDDHVRILTTMAAQIAIAIENARLYQAVKRQEQQLERDIAMAREVQLRLLPSAPLEQKHAEFAVNFLPARSIGGDLYDFIEYGPSQTAIVMGDVSGKAAPAALLAALVSGIMRSAANQRPLPAEMLAILNDALQERKLDSQYVVMLFALWNDENMTLQLANSGAVRPIFCRAGESVPIRAEGFPLGMFPNVTYEEFNVATQPGDAIVFVSDGILDAENEKGEMYGEERLAGLLCSLRGKPAAQICIDYPGRCRGVPGQSGPIRRRNNHCSESEVELRRDSFVPCHVKLELSELWRDFVHRHPGTHHPARAQHHGDSAPAGRQIHQPSLRNARSVRRRNFALFQLLHRRRLRIDPRLHGGSGRQSAQTRRRAG